MIGLLLLVAALVVAAGLVAWGRWTADRRPAPHALVVFRLVLPREAHFSVATAAAWFAALSVQPPVAGPWPWVELVGEDGEIALRLAIPPEWESALRGQLAAWFPGALLEPVEVEPAAPSVTTLALTLARPHLYPLRVAADREPDPLLGLLGALAQRREPGGVRLAWGPAPADWSWWAPAALAAARAGQRPPPRGAWFWLVRIAMIGFHAAAATTPSALAKPVPGLEAAAAKASAHVFSARLAVWSQGPAHASTERVRELAGHLQVGFRDPIGNWLVPAGRPQPADGDTAPVGPTFTLAATELATLFHLPSAENRLLPQSALRQVTPPARLVRPVPGDHDPITWLGETVSPDGPERFGLRPAERRLHTYVVGKTGTGKSTLLASLLQQDLAAGRGVALIDPHGDLAERVLAMVPPERAADVTYFNPADRDWPVGFNILAATSAVDRPLVASGVVGVFKKLYGDSWGPRLEHFLRQTVLALLEAPSPSLLVLPRFLTDRHFRGRLLEHVRDPLLRTFFKVEFEAYDPRWRAEAISPILNKVGQFLASPLVRHVVGQSQPGFDLRQVMDGRGIFIANLASGRIGEDSSDLLGGLLVAGFQLAAMRRADVPESERQDYYLAVDEFQHFANDSFAAILSEARKYRLCLTLSHQYLDQLPPGLGDAVIGNVGNLCVFRVGASDTTRLARELAPVFDAQDLVHLPNYHFCARIARAGSGLTAFSGRTILLEAAEQSIAPVVEASRRRWARPRAEVELEIADLWEGRSD